MKLLAWGIETDKSATTDKAKYLLGTANKYGVQVEFVGLGTQYTADIDKLYTLQKHLQNVNDDELVVCIDAYDTLVNRPFEDLESIYETFNTEVVISAERLFTYQWHTFQDKFELIKSPYKYVNAGTLMGRCKYVKSMVTECIDLLKVHNTKVDQGVLGVWVYNNMGTPSKVKLDTKTQLFWVVSAEWNILKESSESSKVIINPTTFNVPFIIHSTGNKADFHFKCFLSAHKNILHR